MLTWRGMDRIDTLVERVNRAHVDALREAELGPVKGAKERFMTDLSELRRRSPAYASVWAASHAAALRRISGSDNDLEAPVRAWPSLSRAAGFADAVARVMGAHRIVSPLVIEEPEYKEWSAVVTPPVGRAGVLWRLLAGAHVPDAVGPDDFLRAVIRAPWDLEASEVADDATVLWASGNATDSTGWTLEQRMRDGEAIVTSNRSGPEMAVILEDRDLLRFVIDALCSAGGSVEAWVFEPV